MKRLLAFLALVTVAHGAGSVQQSLQQLGLTNNWVLSFQWTGDASTGSVPVTVGQGLNCCTGYFVVQVETVPLSPAPTAGYSVAIQDSSGADVLNGAAGSLSAVSPQAFAASTSAPPLQGVLNLVITGQSVASAKGTVYVFLSKPGSINVATLGRGAVASSANWLTIANPPIFDARVYNFPSQSPGVSLIIGNTNITMTPVPLGLNGSDSFHRVYVSGGVGTAEACLIAGGAGTAGQTSGVITLNCANTHSGAYTITSIDAGIQEAAQAAFTAGGGIVFVVQGTYTVFAALQVQSNVVIQGMAGGTLIKAANQVLARTPSWLNAGAPANPGYYCMICVAAGSSNVVIRDLTVDENGANQTFVYFSGDVELYNTTACRVEGVTVQNRMGTGASGGTGVGFGSYGTASNPPANNINSGFYNDTVDAHPGGCTVPNGGGGFLIEGEGTRITNGYVKDVCDVAYVVSACDHCVVANSIADVGTGQISQSLFSVEGATNTTFSGVECIATGTNPGRYCVGLDSAVPNGLSIQSSGTRVIGVSSTHASGIVEIGLFTNTGSNTSTSPTIDTDIIGAHGDNLSSDCILLSNYVTKVSITGGDIEACGGSGVSIISTGTGVGTTVTDVVISGMRIDHAATAGVIAGNSSGGSNPAGIGLKIIGNFLGDTYASPRALRGVWLQQPYTDVYIVGNTTTGVTSNQMLFQGALTTAVIGPNTTADTSNTITADTLGASVASAATITATGPVFHVTGTTNIANINTIGAAAQVAGITTCLTLIPDGLWSTVTGGNIAIGSTAVVSKQLIMCYDSSATKWYPSY